MSPVLFLFVVLPRSFSSFLVLSATLLVTIGVNRLYRYRFITKSLIRCEVNKNLIEQRSGRSLETYRLPTSLEQSWQSGSDIRRKYATEGLGEAAGFPRDDFLGIQSRCARLAAVFFASLATNLSCSVRKLNLLDSSRP